MRGLSQTEIANMAEIEDRKKNVVANNSIFRETLKKERKAFRLRSCCACANSGQPRGACPLAATLACAAFLTEPSSSAGCFDFIFNVTQCEDIEKMCFKNKMVLRCSDIV